MRRIGTGLIAFSFAIVLVFAPQILADDKKEATKWVTIKGQIVWNGAIPKQAPIMVPAALANLCGKEKAPLEEDYIVNPKNRGLKNVFVWIRPTGAERGVPFPANQIHPNLLKPGKDTVEIDQPCCRFIPHVLAAREGQKLVIKNSAPVAHNSKWDSPENGAFNPIIPAEGEFALPKPLKAEAVEVILACTIHPWMNARIRIFDHPYFAVTDDDGNFEMKLAPTGNFSIFINHPATGWLYGAAGNKGIPKKIDNNLNLGILDMSSKTSP